MTHKVLSAVATALFLAQASGCQQTAVSTHSTSSSGSPVSASSSDPRDANGDPARTGWLSWRGPAQTGASVEKGLPARVSLDDDGSWTYPLAGRGTPVIHEGRVYTMGYEGKEDELEEMIVCLDERNGKRLWEHRFTDFLSDVIYYRFAISSPTIDAETKNVYCMSSSGLLCCFDAHGKLLWSHSMLSEYGRLTFPNGRTGAPVIVDDQCIMHIISSNWGADGPARSRFHAFDKRTGEPRWSSTPGGPPTDSSFSFPVIGTENGRRVLYAGLGGGYVCCINALTGDPVWRFHLANGGLSSSVVRYKDAIIAVNGKENVDSSTIGRLVSIKCGSQPGPDGEQVTLDRQAENWRLDLVSFTSSPTLVGNRVYLTDHLGELNCVDADTGAKLWHEKLAPDQIHASPAYGDGKLYVPMNNGSFYIVEPTAEKGTILQKMQLEGACLGQPAIANGRIYVHTTGRLYCFAGGSGEIGEPAPAQPKMPPPGMPVKLVVVPGDVVLTTGSTTKFRVHSVDETGQITERDVAGATFEGFPGDGVTLAGDGTLTVPAGAPSSANVVQVTAGKLKGSARVRIVRSGKWSLDFDKTVLKPHPADKHMFAFPPAAWPGAKPKWEILELEGQNVLAKTLTNPLFQRTITPIGHPSASNYTMQMDIRTDGNRRIMSSAGMVNQRYLVILKGNHKEIEISSNMELFRKTVPFDWKRDTWYTLKSRVDVNPDGSGVIRAKAWERGQPEPAAWNIEVPHSHVHKEGAPGIYGFVPQSRFRVYIDNISVTPNQ